MRLTGLLAILLFLAIVFFAAPAASYAQTRNSVQPAAATPPTVTATAQPAVPQAHLSRRDVMDESRDGVCYTMRTYVVARESRDSDVTYPKAYYECLPDWKVQTRSIDQSLELHPSR